MTLIVGLGNPGREFENTRHNIGREIAEMFKTATSLPDFQTETKWKAGVSTGKILKEKITVIKPDTFMNKSGLAVAMAARSLKIRPKHIFVIHDDADLYLGRVKLSFGKHSAGHKGVESVIRALKTKEFWRFRIGIRGKKDIPAEKLVLKKWAAEEKRLVKKMVKKTVEAAKQTVLEGPEKTMNEYNK